MFQLLFDPLMPEIPRRKPVLTGEALARRLERISPEGFVLRTGEGEFQFVPGSPEIEGRIRPALQRVPERQFIPAPSIVSTDRIRNDFKRNLDRLQRIEEKVLSARSTPAFIAPKLTEPKQRLSKEGFI